MYIDFAQPISLPPYWLNHPEVVAKMDAGEYTNGDITVNGETVTIGDALSIPHACPLNIKWASETEWWQLPIEPVLTINSKNNIVKRSVLKVSKIDAERRGTVKELWSQDDYEINISGVFIGEDGSLPESDICRLRAYCEARESVEVQSPLFTLFNIKKVAIEDYSFPFTKGIENQMFSIKCTSDDFEEKKLLIAEK